ncbi:hypothetical protein NS365_17875 [Aureimonas ureilytica]|uniref:Uncharacterized protein n=1 Tax=Aureimonas ureilytica TaxID=401562 RepID=A0A175RJW5_9HYPH|nr:hypothetical protein [Aureimonas ureilytica]KTR03653.1 hypothetical protein NS365_17875 [Aureimonas ureilytica]
MPKTIEAFAAYHRQKELLTDYLQVASAGLALLRRNVDVPNAPALLGALVDACGVKHWRVGKQYGSAAEKVEAGIKALGEQGVVQHVAAFDLFSRAAVQDACRFSARARHSFEPLNHEHALLRLSSAKRWVSGHCCNDVAGQLDNLSTRLDQLQVWTGWTPSPALAATLPLFELVRSVRNRIAHDASLVGSHLAELSTSSDTVKALAAFRKTYARADLPTLPEFVRGQPLKLDTVHAILFGAFLYEIAKEVNAHLVGLMDDDEFIDMAFYYSTVVEEHPARTIQHRSPEGRIRHFLADRYLRERGGFDGRRVIERLASQKVADTNDPANDSTYWKLALERHPVLVKAVMQSAASES